jgi:hypothetical protein
MYMICSNTIFYSPVCTERTVWYKTEYSMSISCYLIIQFPIIKNRLHIAYFADREFYFKHNVFSVRYELNIKQIC